MDIRQADAQDYQQLLELLQLLNPDDPVLHAEHGRAVFDQITQSLNNQLWVIENVITDTAYRREGIGKALMQHAIDSAKQAGCYKIMLLTGRDDKVQDFYSSCGFNKKGKQAFIYQF